MGSADTVLKDSDCRAHALAWEHPGDVPILKRLSWMAVSLSLDVPNHIGELFRSYRRCGVFGSPTQSEDIPGETARGIATPALEELNQSGQVDAGDSAEQHVHMRAEY